MATVNVLKVVWYVRFNSSPTLTTSFNLSGTAGSTSLHKPEVLAPKRDTAQVKTAFGELSLMVMGTAWKAVALRKR